MHLERWIVSCAVACESCWASLLRPLGEDAGEVSESEDSGIQPGMAVSEKGLALVACFSRVSLSVDARVSGARELHRVVRRGEVRVVRMGAVLCGEGGGLSEIMWTVGKLVDWRDGERVGLLERGGLLSGLWGGLVIVGVGE